MTSTRKVEYDVKLLPCFAELLSDTHFLATDFFLNWYMGVVEFH